ncbi:hypothetical protein [Paraburkholderia ultramafica]|uniref:hypothetical protein n=1 Tax=Paraburkholderia ultramafica TaxID=1544867 RepID=UPI00158251DC|nr:hypothetical protein [Paraburkholderia ultramafica]
MYRKKYRDLYFCKTTAEPVSARYKTDIPAVFYLFSINRILPMNWCRICMEMCQAGRRVAGRGAWRRNAAWRGPA